MITPTEPSPGVIRLAREYQEVLGIELFENLVTHVWPLWDPTVGFVMFIDDQPTLMSSCVMRVFRAESRTDVTRVPPIHSTEWDHYAISEHAHPRVAVSGRVTVIFLGERCTPYPFRPLTPEELAALPFGSMGKDVFLAGTEAMALSTYQACFLRHDGYVLSQHPAIPNALGFETDDTGWIPKEWFAPLEPGPPQTGVSAVSMKKVTSGSPTRGIIRWTRLRIGDFNLFWIRKLNGSEAQLDHDLGVRPLVPSPSG